jgi:hypothetical protein
MLCRLFLQPYKGKALRLVLATTSILLLSANAAAAQKNCTKGIPCGNSCISASKVCRIGAAPAAPASSSVPASTARSLSAPAAAATDSAVTVASSWVASFADGVYFLAGCPAAQDLAPPNRRYFQTHQEAEDAGYRRSRTPGC